MAEGGKPDYHIGYPSAVWERSPRKSTDLLLKVSHKKTFQNAGPFEVECKIDSVIATSAGSPSSNSHQIANTLMKKVNEDFCCIAQKLL